MLICCYAVMLSFLKYRTNDLNMLHIGRLPHGTRKGFQLGLGVGVGVGVGVRVLRMDRDETHITCNGHIADSGSG